MGLVVDGARVAAAPYDRNRHTATCDAPMTMAVGGGLAAAAATTELVLGGPDAED